MCIRDRGGELVDDAVGEGIAEWNAELEDVDAGTVELEGELVGGGQGRIPGADVDHETLEARTAEFGETFFDAIHGRRSVGRKPSRIQATGHS